MIKFLRSTACNASRVLYIAVVEASVRVRLSVCLSVRHTLQLYQIVQNKITKFLVWAALTKTLVFVTKFHADAL